MAEPDVRVLLLTPSTGFEGSDPTAAVWLHVGRDVVSVDEIAWVLTSADKSLTPAATLAWAPGEAARIVPALPLEGGRFFRTDGWHVDRPAERDSRYFRVADAPVAPPDAPTLRGLTLETTPDGDVLVYDVDAPAGTILLFGASAPVAAWPDEGPIREPIALAGEAPICRVVAVLAPTGRTSAPSASACPTPEPAGGGGGCAVAGPRSLDAGPVLLLIAFLFSVRRAGRRRGILGPMSDSLKDAAQKAGIAPPDEPKPALEKKKWANELPEDETPLERFDAPARTKPVVRPYAPSPKKTP